MKTLSEAASFIESDEEAMKNLMAAIMLVNANVSELCQRIGTEENMEAVMLTEGLLSAVDVYLQR